MKQKKKIVIFIFQIKKWYTSAHASFCMSKDRKIKWKKQKISAFQVKVKFLFWIIFVSACQIIVIRVCTNSFQSHKFTLVFFLFAPNSFCFFLFSFLKFDFITFYWFLAKGDSSVMCWIRQIYRLLKGKQRILMRTF